RHGGLGDRHELGRFGTDPRPVTAPGARRKHRAGTGTVIATQPDRAASFRGARPEGDAAERPDATVRHRSAAPARTNRGHRAERDESGRSHHPARRPAGSRLIASCRALRGVDRSAPRTTRAPGDTGSFRLTVLRPRAVSIFSTPHACRTPPGTSVEAFSRHTAASLAVELDAGG